MLPGKSEDLLYAALDDFPDEFVRNRLDLLSPQTLHGNHVISVDE
jgi:hypothetical protein